MSASGGFWPGESPSAAEQEDVQEPDAAVAEPEAEVAEPVEPPRWPQPRDEEPEAPAEAEVEQESVVEPEPEPEPEVEEEAAEEPVLVPIGHRPGELGRASCRERV